MCLHNQPHGVLQTGGCASHPNQADLHHIPHLLVKRNDGERPNTLSPLDGCKNK